MQGSTARTVSESGQELVELPAGKRSRSSLDSGRVTAQAAQQPETEHGVRGAGCADLDELDEQPGPAVVLRSKGEPLTNEQIEHELRCLAGPSVQLMQQMIAHGVAGRKPPRHAQTYWTAATWVVQEARRVGKASETAETAKRLHAKLEQARKAFGPNTAALTAELHQRKLAAEQGKLDS